MKYAKKLENKFILITIFCLSFIIYYLNCVNETVFFNSDNFYYALAGRDALSGNFLLNGWTGATNTFYFLALLYGILGKVFGYSYHLIYIGSALLWACLIAVLFYIVASIYRYCSRAEKYGRAAVALVVMYTSCYFSQIIKVLSGAHLDIALIGVVYLWIISQEIENEKNNTKALVLSSIFLCIGMVSDQLLLYFFLVPALLVLLYNILFVVNSPVRKFYLKKHIILLLGLIVGTKLVWRVLGITVGTIDIVWSPSGIKFIEYNELCEKAEYFIAQILYLFRCNIFGQSLNVSTILILLQCIGVAVIFFGIVISTKKLWKSIFNQFLYFLLAIVSLIAIFSNYLLLTEENEYSSRVLYCICIAVALFASQIHWNEVVEKITFKVNTKIYYMVGSIFLACLLVLGLSNMEIDSEDAIQNNSKTKAMKILQENNLTNGYATFWLANHTTLLSECTVEVTAIQSNGKDLERYKWLGNGTQEWDYANFIMFDDSGEWGITEDYIEECVGQPDDVIQVDNITIMIWDKNIMPYIGGDNIIALKNWWDFEEGEKEKNITVDELHFCSAFPQNEEGYFESTGQGVLNYGPYQNLNPGVYNISFVFDYSKVQTTENVLGYVDVVSDVGSVVHGKKDITIDNNIVTIENIKIDKICENVELRSNVMCAGIVIKEIIVEKSM